MRWPAVLVVVILLGAGGTAAPLGQPDDPAAAIAAQIRTRYLGSARVCYERGRKQDPALEGRLDLALTVGARGRVSRASVVRSQLGAAVEDCLALAARGWSFRKPGRAVSVTYPFLFRAR